VTGLIFYRVQLIACHEHVITLMGDAIPRAFSITSSIEHVMVAATKRVADNAYKGTPGGVTLSIIYRIGGLACGRVRIYLGPIRPCSAAAMGRHGGRIHGRRAGLRVTNSQYQE
jgi:hypothetical protein